MEFFKEFMVHVEWAWDIEHEEIVDCRCGIKG
jgi:hypothetical protein